MASYQGEVVIPDMVASSFFLNPDLSDPFCSLSTHVVDRIHLSAFFIPPVVYNLYKMIHSSQEWKETRDTREVISTTILNHPGVSLRGIIRLSNVAMGSVQYWLRILEQEGKIEMVKFGKSNHYFDTSQYWSEDARLLFSLLQNQNIAEILQCLHGSSTMVFQKDLCITLGIHKSLLSYYVKILRTHDVIEQNGRGLTISPRFKHLLT